MKLHTWTAPVEARWRDAGTLEPGRVCHCSQRCSLPLVRSGCTAEGLLAANKGEGMGFRYSGSQDRLMVP
eukprot:1383612-Rhodomonas_salina.1